MAATLQIDQRMPRAVAGEMAHVARLHDAIVTAADPEIGHRQVGHQVGNLADRPPAGAVHQQAEGSAFLRLKRTECQGEPGAQPHHQAAAAAQALERPRLVDAATGSNQHQGMETPRRVVFEHLGRMQGHTRPKGMAHQDDRSRTSLGDGLIRQPAAVGRQGGQQGRGAMPFPEAR